MPTHGGEQWIDTALRSIADEAAEGLEVLVLDSSPTPATVNIARRYTERLNLRIVEHPSLVMWPAKTNHGVAMSQAPHVCWLHQDDLWLPGRAAAVRAWVAAAPHAPLHLAPCAIIDRNGRMLGVWRCPLPPGVELPAAMVTERLLVQNFIAAPAPVFRRDAWLACGGMDEALWYTGDWDIWLKLAARGPVYYHDGVTTAFRIHGASLTMTGRRDQADFTSQMQTVLDRHLAQISPESTAIERAARASIVINGALAAASAGDFSGLWPAASAAMRLGPAGLRRYARDSRIAERLAPRLRAKLGGAF